MRKTSDSDEFRVDYVVVGAGSAGCVLANRLSADGRSRVAVLEAGGSDLNFWVRMPIGYGGAFYHPRLNWRYTTEPEPELGGRKVYWPRGKVIGGSSSINAMVFIRGQAEDYDGWAALGNPGWAYGDVLPHFKRMEDNLAGADEWRGAGGPITVSPIDASVHPLSHDYVAAGQVAGLSRNPDFNGKTQEGVGLYQITTRKGFRCSAATGYLTPARRRANLRVITHAHVTRILFDGRRAVGVEYRRGNSVQRIMADREVILSAGAVNSPQILQLSGIGDAAHLQQCGIDVVQDAGGVGRNLQDHIGYDYIYEATCPTLNNHLRPWLGRMLLGLRYVLTRSGPLSLSVNQGGGFFKSAPDRDRPNLQLYFSPVSYTKATPGKRKLLAPDKFPGLLIGISNCHPKSRGHLQIRSADPFAAPEIHPGYLSAPEDLDELAEGAEMIRRIAGSQPLAKSIRREVLPGADVTDRDAIREDIRQRLGTVFHACGTCAMGPDRAAGAVVDARLKVHGVGGLRVADASIFPRITSGNLNAPAIMVGEKAAQMILEDRG
ncbi:GMC family oxidoreductase N-terminal domain-containing protein [Roseovarius sp. CAU 1744]|uniref:GMC family oxidoreductase n=1 Tax=Roseovarius sp. CAU 1744 TaxID=3140368 RepID=UPI00325BAB49